MLNSGRKNFWKILHLDKCSTETQSALSNTSYLIHSGIQKARRIAVTEIYRELHELPGTYRGAQQHIIYPLCSRF